MPVGEEDVDKYPVSALYSLPMPTKDEKFDVNDSGINQAYHRDFHHELCAIWKTLGIRIPWCVCDLVTF